MMAARAGISMLLLSTLLALLSWAAAMPAPAAEEGGTAPTTRSLDAAQDADDVDGRDDDDIMRDRMAYLILSLWGEDLEAVNEEQGAYRDPAEASPLYPRTEHSRRKRDFVFRPLWVTRERNARTQRLRQRYWEELRRSQRVGRDVQAVEAGLTRRRRDAAPMPEDALVSGTPGALSRVRRQWVNRPLFATRQRNAARRFYRFPRSVEDPIEHPVEHPVEHPENLAQAAASDRSRGQRRRREWTDVPLFAVKQIEAARVREENEITHPHHHGQQQHQQQRQEYDGEDRAEYNRLLDQYNRELDEYSRLYNNYHQSRPYRDYSQYNG